MWTLQSLRDPALKFSLFVGVEYTVGRKDCKILIQNDSSISRQHAVLTVVHPESNVAHPDRKPSVTIKDLSKFGTFIDNIRVCEYQTVSPAPMKILIKFGSVDSEFTLSYEPFILTTSCLDAAKKKKVKSLVHKLGGHVSVDYTAECCMVVMSNLSVTIKVICALVNFGNIVTSDYLVEYVNSITNKKELPDPDAFLPPLAESQIDPNEISFQRKDVRKMLFADKKFFFLTSKQYDKLHVAVEMAGGTAILARNEHSHMLTKPESIVMYSDPNEQSQAQTQNTQDRVNHVISYLCKYGKRAIPEAEFGYAVLYCSIEKYCNPDAKVDANFFPVPSQSLSQKPETLVPQSQSQIHDKTLPLAADVTTNIIDETTTSQLVSTVAVKIEPRSQTIVSRDSSTTKIPEVINGTSKKRQRAESPETSAPLAKLIKSEIKSEDATAPVVNNDLFDFVAMPRSSRRSQIPEKTVETALPNTAENMDTNNTEVIDDFNTIMSGRRRRTLNTKSVSDNGQNRIEVISAAAEQSVSKSNDNASNRNSKQSIKTESDAVEIKETLLADEFDAIPALPRRRTRIRSQDQNNAQRKDDEKSASGKTELPSKSCEPTQPIEIKNETVEMWNLAEAEPTSHGYLSKQHTGNSETPRTAEHDPDPDIRCGCMNVRVVPLVHRPMNTINDDDTEIVARNGHPVRNFKKFKKVLPVPVAVNQSITIQLAPHKDIIKQQEFRNQQDEIERIQSQEQDAEDEALCNMFDTGNP
ncbi:uncharacterized protein LOC141902512 isoform X2 [Tubulanus polymorphus]|uniref:uncharacterized protein LOC141902512 isoform X2 n=1 Tax=Tubulanus polymorphus TaxID=672921 RepID=UPI003DA5F073